MTLVGFIIVLAVVGVFAYMGMKVIPMYSEYYSVKQAMAGVAQQAGVANEDIGTIKDHLFKRLYINYAETVKPENVKVVRKDSGYVMTVEYEVRKPLIYNLDVVGNFKAEQELRRNPLE